MATLTGAGMGCRQFGALTLLREMERVQANALPPGSRDMVQWVSLDTWRQEYARIAPHRHPAFEAVLARLIKRGVIEVRDDAARPVSAYERLEVL